MLAVRWITFHLPTIVLVHGAWHTPYYYRPYITALQKHGFVVHCPRLPSSINIIESLVNGGKYVLMVMHSYGGLVGANAIKGLSRAEHQRSRQPGGVIHLLYLCTYLLMAGETVWGKVEAFGYASIWPQFMDDTLDSTTIPKDPELSFYGGINKQIIKSDLVPHLVCAPLSSLPAMYVFTQQDYAVPREFQNQMVSRARGHGISLCTEDYNTSHSIFLTRTAEMVQAAERAAMDGRDLA
ncbi:alpha/beta-hydrolase [Aspergillus tetrazonus]